jgi:hypothetical protein
MSDAQLGTQPVDTHLVRNRRVTGAFTDNANLHLPTVQAFVCGIGNPVLQDVMICLCDSFRELLKKIETSESKTVTSSQQHTEKVNFLQKQRFQLRKKSSLVLNVTRARRTTSHDSIHNEPRRLSPSEYIKRFQDGEGLPANDTLAGLCGR